MLARIKPYVIGKGLTDPFDLTPGDKVYTIDEQLNISIRPIDSVTTDFYADRINIVKSGQNQSVATDTTRYMYVTGDMEYKTKFIKWDQIDAMTPNKEAIPTKYLPVLTYLDGADREYEDLFIDGLARKLYLGEVSMEDKATIKNMRGRDGVVLITLMEEYYSSSPGKGLFGRASVKDRVFYLEQKWLSNEIARIAVLSGYTAQAQDGVVQVNFESTPVPGSIPKNEKYFKEPFADYVFAINAGNLPILGRSLSKWCFMPTAEEE